MRKIRIVIGVLGLLGTILCGASVATQTFHLGQPQNYVGALLIVILCSCAFACCLNVIRKGN